MSLSFSTLVLFKIRGQRYGMFLDWARKTKISLIYPRFLAFLLCGSFFYKSVAIGIEQFLQVGYLPAKFCALVGVGHEHAVGTHFDDDRGALDVCAALYGVFGGGEGFVLY